MSYFRHLDSGHANIIIMYTSYRMQMLKMRWEDTKFQALSLQALKTVLSISGTARISQLTLIGPLNHRLHDYSFAYSASRYHVLATQLGSMHIKAGKENQYPRWRQVIDPDFHGMQFCICFP